MTRTMRAAFATGLVLGLLASPALAAWISSGTGSGQVSSTNMPTGEQPETHVEGRDVTVSWAASHFPGTAAEVASYEVRRYPHATEGDGVAVTCAGTEATRECTDVNAPSGDLWYAVVPVHHNWVGDVSERAAQQVGAPALTLATSDFPADESRELTGTIEQFMAGGELSFHLDTADGLALTGSPESVTSSASVNVSVTLPENLDEGTHKVVAVATYPGDVTESADSSEFNVTAPAPADTTPPTSAITFPVANGAYNAAGWAEGCEPAGLCGTAADDQALAKVEISLRSFQTFHYWSGSAFDSVQEQWLTVPGTTDWSYAIDLDDLPEARYTLRSRATDAAGNVETTPQSTTFFIDTTPPTGEITQPNADGVTVRGANVVVKTDPGDSGPGASGVAEVQFQYKLATAEQWTDLAAAGAPNYETRWDTTALADGEYHLRAVITDRAGNVHESTPRPVKVGNILIIEEAIGEAQLLSGGRWDANVRVRIVDNFDAPIAGAVVTGSWSFGGSGGSPSGATSCTTESDGRCTVSAENLHKDRTSATFTIHDVSRTHMTYAPPTPLLSTTVNRPS